MRGSLGQNAWACSRFRCRGILSRGGDGISLTQLAAMESGVADYSGSQAFIDAFLADFEHEFTPAELVDYAAALPLGFDPGARYEYNNTDTVLLGMVGAHRLGTRLPGGDALQPGHRRDDRGPRQATPTASRFSRADNIAQDVFAALADVVDRESR